MSAEPQPQTDGQITKNPFTGLTAFQRDLLLAIDDVEKYGSDRDYADVYGYEEPTGQCIRDMLEKSGYEDINSAQIYPNLDKLVSKGLVEKGSVDRRTNAYTLTSEGAEKVSEYVEFVRGE